MGSESPIRLQSGDALIAVDVQIDFLPGGSLAVPQGDAVVPALNRYLRHSARVRCPCSPRAIGIRPITVRSRPRAASGRRIASPRRAAPIRARSCPACRGGRHLQGGDAGDRQLFRLRRHRSGRAAARHGRQAPVDRRLATDYCVLNTVSDARRKASRCCCSPMPCARST